MWPKRFIIIYIVFQTAFQVFKNDIAVGWIQICLNEIPRMKFWWPADSWLIELFVSRTEEKYDWQLFKTSISADLRQWFKANWSIKNFYFQGTVLWQKQLLWSLHQTEKKRPLNCGLSHLDTLQTLVDDLLFLQFYQQFWMHEYYLCVTFPAK